MTIRVRLDKDTDKITVETDSPDGGADQRAVYNNPAIAGYMRRFDIKEAESSDYSGLLRDLDDDYKQRTNRQYPGRYYHF